MKREGITVKGHKGTWYIIDEGHHNGKQVFLLEHETYGEDALCIIVDSRVNIIMEDVSDGLSQLTRR